MNANLWFSFDPRLSWDGLLTFLGGLLAFFAILYQVRHADSGLRQQLESEKKARDEEELNQKRAVATAILFEIDHFYRFYIQDVLKLLETRSQPSQPVVIKVPNTEVFPVYSGNCSRLGELSQQLVEATVHFYGMANGYVSELRERGDICNEALGEDSPRGFARAESLLPRTRSQCEALIPMAFLACGFLSDFTGVDFGMPRVAVAEDKHVTAETRDWLRIGIEGLHASIGTR